MKEGFSATTTSAVTCPSTYRAASVAVKTVFIPRVWTIAPVTNGDAMLVPDLNPVKSFGKSDCILVPGAKRSTHEPKFE